MTDHLTLMFNFIDELETLDAAQGLVDLTRTVGSANQRVQLEMDREQAEIDRKRAWVGMMMADIRSRN